MILGFRKQDLTANMLYERKFKVWRSCLKVKPSPAFPGSHLPPVRSRLPLREPFLRPRKTLQRKVMVLSLLPNVVIEGKLITETENRQTVLFLFCSSFRDGVKGFVATLVP